MTNYLPLNGDRLLGAAETALRTPSAATIISQHLAGTPPEQSSSPVARAAPARATDPSQGRGPARRYRSSNDPLLEAIWSLRSTQRRRW